MFAFIRNLVSTEKKRELASFIFVSVFLFPIISFVLVGGYGFSIWMLQLLSSNN